MNPGVIITEEDIEAWRGASAKRETVAAS
jgi:hypothetical protein